MVDVKKLEKRFDGSRETMREVANEYFKLVREVLDSCLTAMNEDDSETVHTQAHKLKGSARLLGADKLGDLAEKMEHAAAIKEMDAVRQLYPDFKTEATESIQTLRRYLQK